MAGRSFLTPGHPGVTVKNVRRKSGLKSLCLCCFFFPEDLISIVVLPSLREVEAVSSTLRTCGVIMPLKDVGAIVDASSNKPLEADKEAEEEDGETASLPAPVENAEPAASLVAHALYHAGGNYRIHDLFNTPSM